MEGKELEDYMAAKERRIKEEEEDVGKMNIDAKDSEASESFHLQSARTKSGALARLASVSTAVADELEHGFKDVLIEGFVPNEDCAGPLFPFGEKVKEADEYGEAIDELHFKVEMQETQEDLALNGNEDAMDVELEAESRPTKVVTIGMTLHIRATVMLLDFEGKSDSYSMKTIIGNVGPRELVVVSGSQEAVRMLIQGVKSEDLQKVYSPGNLQFVNISSIAVSSCSLKMSEDLLGVIQLQSIGPYSVAWVQGKVESRENESGAAGHVLAPIEKQYRTQHNAAFVGDFSLGDLRQDLLRKGIKTELVQGVLVCDNLISIQRVGTHNEIVIQGPLSPKYYRVREIVYSQFSVCS